VRRRDDHHHPCADRLHPVPAAAAGVRLAGHLEVAIDDSQNRPPRPPRRAVPRRDRGGIRIRLTMTYSHPMPLHQPTRRRRIALVVVGALAVALTGSLGIARPWMPPAETAPIAAAPGGISPAALTLPDDPTVLVFGDSWTYGSAATPPTLGYAYLLADLLHGTTVVDGV